MLGTDGDHWGIALSSQKSSIALEEVYYTSSAAVGWPRAYMAYLEKNGVEMSPDEFFAAEVSREAAVDGALKMRGLMLPNSQQLYFRTQKLSPVYSPNTKPTLQWNGLPEKHKNDLFRDSEHTDDFYTKDNKDPFGPSGQYGMWMGIQGDTKNDWYVRLRFTCTCTVHRASVSSCADSFGCSNSTEYQGLRREGTNGLSGGYYSKRALAQASIRQRRQSSRWPEVEAFASSANC